jgi:Tfp pilus assembly protein PilV
MATESVQICGSRRIDARAMNPLRRGMLGAISPTRSRARGLRGCAGASLVELIIATLILGIVSVALVQFFARGRVWFDQEERKRVATLLAQEACERTVSQPYANIAAWNETRRVSMRSYGIAVTVQNDTPETDVKTVRSTVTWQATPSAQRSVALATMVFRK